MSETTVAKPESTFGEYLKRQAEKTFRRSDSIAALAAALSKAQGEIEAAKKDSENPYFKSHYADLASVWDVIRKPFSEAGLAVMQFPRSTRIPSVKPDEDDSGLVEVETVLAHSSGEWVSETLAMPVANYTAHGVGAAITYGRRYALISFAGVSAEDDDGNGAVEPNKFAAANSLRNSTLAALTTIAQQGTDALADAWNKLTKEARKACQADLPSLKARAEQHAATAGMKGHGGNKPEPSNPIMELQDHILVECKCGWEHFQMAAMGTFWPDALKAHSFADVPLEVAQRIMRDKDGLKSIVQAVRDSMKKKEVAT
jgi:hypothetical protein